jgi:hypothetical protein
MSEKKEKTYTLEQCNKLMAVNTFNLVWDLMDKADRTVEDDDRMVHAAHASRFHWDEIGEPLNFQRGEWQVSRVYAVLKRPAPSLYHAQRCLDLTEKNDIGGFDRAFAYEAMARAYAIAGKDEDTAKYMKLAQEAAEKIEKKEDREYVEGELKTIPGWGS